MISYLNGSILKKGINYIVVNVNNVGYKVFVNEKMLSSLAGGDEVKIWTHQYVREDSLDLYGFSSDEELELFELLISISGVGPKSALAVLAIASVDDIKGSIVSGDPSLLTKVSGIGKKTAERVVLELKDKMAKLNFISKTSGQPASGTSYASDEIDALVALGYSLQQAREALSKVDPEINDPGERIKQALKAIKN
ncbi:Holliday junction branch migration protein RuvA [Candidatus Falkowbacteria bacterium]|nr:Holliday junction branch migration protein RuvA [Candidatus Falkowbacteria bacterium]